jgi:hypothetical protein
MEHTLRAMRITVAPMGVFMTASEANRQRVLTLLLAEREQMCTSVWAVTDGPVDGVSRVPIGWSPMVTFRVSRTTMSQPAAHISPLAVNRK